MKKIFYFTFIFFFGFCGGGDKDNNPAITGTELLNHVKYLASDELAGRLTGTEGFDKASEYIEEEFESYGLKPFNNNYLQKFPFIASISLTGDNSLTINSGKNDITPELNKDYIPTPFTDNLSFSGEAFFAGYGISAPDLKYDDYEGIDVTGKAVIVLRHHPEHNNPHSEYDKYSAMRYKANTAKEKGASAIIFVNGWFPKDDDDKLMKLRYDSAPPIDSIASVQIKRYLLEQIIMNAGLDLRQIQANIDSTKTPGSFAIENTVIELETGIEQVEMEGTNVVGYIEGNDPVLKNEYLVIGAHYDHLGFGETGSLYRGDEQEIHNGADDNASGTAGMLELAEKFASEKNSLKRSIIFIAFGGEELGLLGSTYFVNNSPVPADKMNAMLNMDMIGRLNEEKSLMVYGTGTSGIWKDLVNKVNEKYSFKITMHDEGYGPSDHSSFYGKNIPVLFFFTGVHSDYHRPSDDADKINREGIEAVAKAVYEIADAVDKSDTKPDYVNVPRKDSGTMRSFRVYVGTVPDYAGEAGGLKITGVTEGSPAQKGGLKGGDVIINFGGKKIDNIYDYTYALGEFSPGDIVDVVVKRDNQEVTLKVELGAR